MNLANKEIVNRVFWTDNLWWKWRRI